MRGTKWAGLEIVVVNGRSKAKGVCEVCSQEFLYNPYKSFGKFCSRKCSSIHQKIARRGGNNHNWKGGAIDFYGDSWEQAQLQARMRDKVCQGCGISPEELGIELDVHHIKPFRDFGVERHAEANQLDNLICYCRSCHMSYERKTDQFKPRNNGKKKPIKRNPNWKPKDTSKTEQGTCPMCGNVFIYYKCWPKKFCSYACYVASLPKPVEKHCPECDKVFTYYESWPRIYCSNRCKMLARNREKQST